MYCLIVGGAGVWEISPLFIWGVHVTVTIGKTTMKLYEGSVVVYLPEEYLTWLDKMKALRFTRKEIVKFALDQVIAMDRKELVSRLSVARLPESERGEVAPS